MKPYPGRSRMTNLLLAIMAVLALVASAGAEEKPKFEGVWSLDKAKSSNLPPIFEAVDEYLFIIKQADDKSITFSTKFQGRGQTISSEPETYPIDGSTVERKDPRGVLSKRSFQYNENGLVVVTEKLFTGEVQLPNSLENELWELKDSGNTLSITITPKKEGSQKQVRVFTKKPQP